MKALIKNTALPYRGEPTRAAYKKPVQYYDPKHMIVVELPPNLPKRYEFPKGDPERTKRIQRSRAKTMERKKKLPRGWNDDMVVKLKRLYNEGMLLKDISIELGVKYSTMTGYIGKLQDWGELEQRPEPNMWTNEEVRRLKELREQGKTFEEIGTILSRSPNGCGNKYRKEFVP